MEAKVCLCAVVVLCALLSESLAQSPRDCGTGDGSVSCHGTRIVRSIVKRLAYGKSDDEGSLKLFPGVEIVETVDGAERERSLYNGDEEDKSMMGRVSRYLRSHEIKINFGQLLRKSDIQDAIRTAIGTMDQEIVADVVEARKKDKGGLGAIMMMGLMMGKLLAALGFGGVGLLALKALGVSMIALLLSAILGLKKLTEQGDHKGRHNDEHLEVQGDDQMQHASRKRRSAEGIDLAYRGWANQAL